MARKGQFKKGGGRHGGATATKRRRSSSSRALVVVAPSAPARRQAKRRRSTAHHITAHKPRARRRGGGGHSLPSIGKVAGAALVLSSVAGTNNGPAGAKIYDLVQKLPGAKTFGGAATAGLYIGGLHRFTRIGGRFRPLMAAAGLVGVVAALLKVGEAGTSFKFLGGDDDLMHVG